jgi:hypothetical protein
MAFRHFIKLQSAHSQHTHLSILRATIRCCCFSSVPPPSKQLTTTASSFLKAFSTAVDRTWCVGGQTVVMCQLQQRPFTLLLLLLTVLPVLGNHAARLACNGAGACCCWTGCGRAQSDPRCQP